MSGADEKMRGVIKLVSNECWHVSDSWRTTPADVEKVLERRLLPLLLVGQAMRDSAWVNAQQRKDYDTALNELTGLAAAQGQPEKESGR